MNVVAGNMDTAKGMGWVRHLGSGQATMAIRSESGCITAAAVIVAAIVAAIVVAEVIMVVALYRGVLSARKRSPTIWKTT